MLRGTAVVVMVCALGSAAYADNKEAAKQAYTEGKRQYDLGDYGAALDAFKRAYLNYEEPVFLFNSAQCYRALGDRQAAVRTYRAFLRNWPKAPNREQVERIIAELEAAIAQDQSARAVPPQDTLPPRGAEATKPPPAETTTPPTATPPQHDKPTVAMTPPPHTTPPPPNEPEPAQAKAPPSTEAVGMVEIEPNFDRPSGSNKPVKWWAWTLIAVGVGGLVAAAVVIGVTQASPKFDPTLPPFNVNNTALRTATVRF